MSDPPEWGRRPDDLTTRELVRWGLAGLGFAILCILIVGLGVWLLSGSG